MSASDAERVARVPAVRIGNTERNRRADSARPGVFPERVSIALVSFEGENLVPSGKITKASSSSRPLARTLMFASSSWVSSESLLTK